MYYFPKLQSPPIQSQIHNTEIAYIAIFSQPLFVLMKTVDD